MRGVDEATRLKYQAAQRLGLMEKLLEAGWAGLSAQETGRVGGLVSAMRRERNREGHVHGVRGGIRPPDA